MIIKLVMNEDTCSSKMKYKGREVHVDAWITVEELSKKTAGMFTAPLWCLLHGLRSGDFVQITNGQYFLMLRVCEFAGWKGNLVCEIIHVMVENLCPYKIGDIVLIELRHVLHIIPHDKPKIWSSSECPNLRVWLHSAK